MFSFNNPISDCWMEALDRKRAEHQRRTHVMQLARKSRKRLPQYLGIKSPG